MDHHPIFSEFSAFRGQVPVAYEVDYIGAKSLALYLPGFTPRATEDCAADLPLFDEEYFEWIDILESVAIAGEAYTMLEVGAGYGRWCVRAALAARQKNIAQIRIGAVEAEPAHLEWLKLHLENNQIKLADVDIFDCLVSDKPGKTYFYVQKPEGSPSNAPNLWYGQAKMKDYEVVAPGNWLSKLFGRNLSQKYKGRELVTFKSGWRAIEVPQRAATELLETYTYLDLVDIDIQGEEYLVVSNALGPLSKKVKRLHIGTHSVELEEKLYELLSGQKWECLRSYRCGQVNPTPYGDIPFVDGLQTWVNPRLQ